MSNNTSILQKNDLLYVAKHINEMVQYFLPYSSNKLFGASKRRKDCYPDGEFGGDFIHREIWIALARHRKDAFQTKKQILQWHMNLRPDYVNNEFSDRKIFEGFEALQKPGEPIKFPITFGDIDEYVSEMEPLTSDKLFHKNGQPFDAISLIEQAAKNAVNLALAIVTKWQY